MKNIFLSHARSDEAVARRIAGALRSSGTSVAIDEWQLDISDSIKGKVSEELSASDFLIVLLSKQSLASRWVRAELEAHLALELRDRAITLIPVLIEDCELPERLADRPYIDLTRNFDEGVKRLVEQIAGPSEIQLAQMGPQQFENLVYDLLVDLGFTVQRTPRTRDGGFDFVATYPSRDPFGAPRRQSWLVEAKSYRTERVSVSALHQMLGYLAAHPTARNALVVTNSRLTSAARDFLRNVGQSFKGEFRVVDGGELTKLLAHRPEIARRYANAEMERGAQR